jgi:hypothetical protein
MAQADYVVANGTGAAVRSDLNGQLAAIVSNNSGATEPATMYAYQWWADTTTGLLKLRNSANSGWVTIRQLDGEFSTVPVENGTAAAPSIFFKDSGTDTGLFSPGADQVAISTGGTGRLFIDSSGRLLVGTSTARDKLFNGTTSTNIPQFQSERAGGGLVNRLLVTGNNGTVPANEASQLILARSYGTTLNSYTAVTSADSHLGAISFQGADGTEFVEAASIQCFTDAACGANDMPGRIVLATTADGASSPTERVRLTSAGRLGIGAASPGSVCHVAGSNGDGLTVSGGGATGVFRSSASGTELGNTSGDHTVFLSGSGTERMRLGSDGILYLGATSTVSTIANARLQVIGPRAATFQANSGVANNQVVYFHHTNTSGDNLFVEFGTEASIVTRGTVDYNRAAGQVRYNTTSDRRLKSDIQPASTALNALSAIQVRSYKWAETGYQVDHGFIAQELNDVAPDAVKVGDDGDEVTDTWAVDNGKLVPLLTKALQEAIAKIETLEARLSALESA